MLSVLRAGERMLDKSDKTEVKGAALKLPDEAHGYLFVFRVFDRVSYALILSAETAVRPGDRFTPP